MFCLHFDHLVCLQSVHVSIPKQVGTSNYSCVRLSDVLSDRPSSCLSCTCSDRLSSLCISLVCLVVCLSLPGCLSLSVSLFVCVACPLCECLSLCCLSVYLPKYLSIVSDWSILLSPSENVIMAILTVSAVTVPPLII